MKAKYFASFAALALAATVSATQVFATTAATTPTTADTKVQFDVFTPNSNTVNATQPLQVLTLEKARPDLYAVNVRYFTEKTDKFKNDTFWRSAYVAKYHRDRLADWLQCVSYDPETHTCGSLLGIDVKKLSSKEKELRAELHENFLVAKKIKMINGGFAINGAPYNYPMAYGELLNNLNQVLPKAKQLTGLGKYEVTKLYIIGNEKGLGARDTALEREFVKWIPNLSAEILAPDSSKAAKILKSADAPGIPSYVFDKASLNNVAVQKLARAGRVKASPAGYAIFEMKSGVTETRLDGTEIPNQLDLWVMSQCPFGVKAENALITAQAQKLVAEGTKINLRYIVSERKVDGKTTWDALHGDPELQENIRQAVIQKTWPDKFWQYLSVRNADYKSDDWQSAATKVGIVPADVEAKMSLGRKLIAQDIKDGAKLKISGSPTYLWQNRYVLNNTEDLKSALGFDPTSLKATEEAPRQPSGKEQKEAPAAAPAPASAGQCG